MHPNRAKHITAIRNAMTAANVEETDPFMPGLDQQSYQLNLQLWLALHKDPEKYLALSYDRRIFFNRMSSWAYANKELIETFRDRKFLFGC